MGEVGLVILYSFLSGITVFLGGLLSKLEAIPEGAFKKQFLHTTVAFGGGVLVAAVCFVLIPEGIKQLSLAAVILLFLAGAFSFFLLDQKLSRQNSSKGQFLAMLTDFIPEAIAMGAVFAYDKNLGLLLAIFIGLQNLPESFNAFFELVKSGLSEKKVLLIFVPLSFLGVLGALLGYFFLSGYPKIISGLMVFAGSGILYIIFQDIAPLSKTVNSSYPALGASLGFLLGIIGQILL